MPQCSPTNPIQVHYQEKSFPNIPRASVLPLIQNQSAVIDGQQVRLVIGNNVSLYVYQAFDANNNPVECFNHAKIWAGQQGAVSPDDYFILIDPAMPFANIPTFTVNGRAQSLLELAHAAHIPVGYEIRAASYFLDIVVVFNNQKSDFDEEVKAVFTGSRAMGSVQYFSTSSQSSLNKLEQLLVRLASNGG